jgi:iron complex outermembrane recepter protein
MLEGETMKAYQIRMLGGAAAVVLAASTALADTPAPPSGQDNPDIVVSARKREEPLSQTPIAITAIRGDVLRDRGLTRLEDIATVTPGVSFREDVAGRAGPAITIRGIGFDDYHANGSPSAAVHIDEVYQGSSAWITGQLFDIDHVEILKGPQGTLYGQNTTAGAINVLTRQPTATPQGYLDASYGSYGALRVEGALGGPVAQDLSARFAFLRQSGGGFLKSRGDAAFAGTTPVPGVIPGLPLVKPEDGFGDADFWGVRGTVRYEPSSTTRITAEVNYGRDRGANSQTDVRGRSATGFTEPDNDPYTFYANVLPFIHADQVGGRLKLEQDIGGVTFTGIAGQQHLKRSFTLDPGSPLRAFDILYRDRLDQTTLEARLANHVGGPIDWILGGFYFRDRVHTNQNEDVTDLYRSTINADALQHRESEAVFGEANWHFTPKLTATLGLRYTHEDARYQGATIDTNPYGRSIVANAFKLPVLFDNHFSDGNVSGRAVLTYRPGDGAMLYGSVSRGFKSGGFDGATIFTASKALPFKSEHVWAYEVGAKWFPHDQPFNFSAAGFYDDFSNLQATATVNLGGIPTNVRTNVAAATIYGGELEAGVRPLPGLDLTAGISLLHSRIDDVVSVNAAEAARREGKPLPDAPGLSFTLGARYRHQLANGWAIIPDANLSYTGSQYKEIDHYIKNGRYALLDARIAIEAPGGHWSLAIWARNLTDKAYFVGLVPAVSGTSVIGAQRIVGTPRTVGGELGYHF